MHVFEINGAFQFKNSEQLYKNTLYEPQNFVPKYTASSQSQVMSNQQPYSTFLVLILDNCYSYYNILIIASELNKIMSKMQNTKVQLNLTDFRDNFYFTIPIKNVRFTYCSFLQVKFVKLR